MGMFCLNIGVIEIEVVSDRRDFLMDGLACFLSESGGSGSAIKLEVHMQSRSRFPGLSSPNPAEVYSRDGRMVIKGRDFGGYLDLNGNAGEAEISSGDSFESFLRITLSLILPNRDGIAIHASSLVKDGRAYVFPGKPGAGKTTIVKLSPDATLLTDEISIIRGIGETPRAYGTPFYGDLGIPGENTSAPVAGLYFPVKDGKNYVERLDSRSALEQLLPNVILFGQDQELMRKAFYLSCELAASVPCYALHFLPDPSFWSCIDEQKRKD